MDRQAASPARQLPATPRVDRSAPDGWAAAHEAIGDTVAGGRPIVVAVVVALCSNEQIACGSRAAGDPGGLDTNLYWGALFGARRFFDRPGRGWELVDQWQRPSPSATSSDGRGASPECSLSSGVPLPGQDSVLERIVYRRTARAARWGRDGAVELLVVLEAVHGQAIDAAVDRFWQLATEGGALAFDDGVERRSERVTVAGYAGHNRLLDGKRLPGPPPGHAVTAAAAPADAQATTPLAERSAIGPAAPLPSFVLACLSERFFGGPLRSVGSDPLLTTGAFMAPEGYVIDATVRAIGDNVSRQALRQAAIDAAMHWQGLPRADAERTFVSAGRP